MLDGGGEEEHRAAHRGIRPAVAKLRGAGLALEIGNTASSTPAGGALFHRQGAGGAVRSRPREERRTRTNFDPIDPIGRDRGKLVSSCAVKPKQKRNSQN